MDFLRSILILQNVSLRYWTNKDTGRSNQLILSTRCWEKKTHFNVLGLLEWLTCPPRWHGGKESACNAGDTREASSIPGLGRCPGEGNSNPLQYSCLENPRDRGAWRAIVHGATKSWTQLSKWTQHNNKTTCVMSDTAWGTETLTNALLFGPAQFLWTPVPPAHLHVPRAL